MPATRIKPEVFFLFSETRLLDGTYLFDDDEALIEYEVQPEEKDLGIEKHIKITAVILIDNEGNLTDEDILPKLTKETKSEIISEVIESF